MTETNGTLKYVRNVQGCRNKADVVEMRDGIMSYVNGEGEPNGKWPMLDTHREGKNSLPTYTFRLTFNTKNVVTYLRIILKW